MIDRVLPSVYNGVMSIVAKIVDLIRETSSSLPDDVEKVLRSALRKEEKGGSAAVILKTILDNCALARKQGTPLCQDTGTLTFFVDASLRRKVTPAVLKKAVAKATELGYLRKNCIDSVTGKSYDDNCAEGAPVVHYLATDGTSGGPAPLPKGGVMLMMKGGPMRRSGRDAISPASGNASSTPSRRPRATAARPASSASASAATARPATKSRRSSCCVLWTRRP